MLNNHHYNKDLKEYARELRTKTVSRAEKRIWKTLLSRKQMGVGFKRQRPVGFYIVDFLCQDLWLIIEIDGNSHMNKGAYDRHRQNYLEALGFKIVRFTEGEVIHQLDDVMVKLNGIINVLKEEGDSE